jgi:altronate hydrolase
MRSLLILHPKDNVAIALTSLHAGQAVEQDGRSLIVQEDIPAGHKLALTAIPPGEGVVKYGEEIGRAKALIRQGAHAHAHNIIDITEEVVTQERRRLGL